MTTETTVQQNNTGGAFLVLLTLVLVGLRLTGEIDWSWWWVVSPLWLPVAIIIAFGLFAGLIALLIIILRPLFAALRSLMQR